MFPSPSPDSTLPPASGGPVAPLYLSGFGNAFESEAEPGALPPGRNSPQRHPLGLYAELLSGRPFTAPRHEQRRTWLYRIRPSASHPPFEPVAAAPGFCGALAAPNPNRLRWSPPAPLERETDFLDGLSTVVATAPAEAASGLSVHLYQANRSMRRVMFDADAELLIVPQAGALRLATECGRMEVAPGAIALIPRGMRFRVELAGPGEARGYVGENFGQPFRLPELGPIGSNGLANARDFLTPVAAYEDVEAPTELVQKFRGRLWRTTLDHSPLDVVGWHGDHAPWTYDLARFNTMGTVSFDHPDPSIYTVLTSPSDTPGTANADFVIFPPRWLVAEDTFRPPWYHRNIMNEYMGLVQGAYDAKAEGFLPGGGSLHACMNAHGPDAQTARQAREATLAPVKVADTLAFMFETYATLIPTEHALASETLQPAYDACWDDIPRLFRPRPFRPSP